jgi:hypothetical protein
VRSADAKELAHLAKGKIIKKPKLLPQTADEPANLERIKFLESKDFQYKHNIKSNELFRGLNVKSFVESLASGEEAFLGDSKVSQGSGVAMFCGGPVSALAFCPRIDPLGKLIQLHYAIKVLFIR